ncbi:Pol Polyprotein [Phytophthora megakarya]|uniref:Pol Polyprotein n=1 Tax=Phytophthora megakarya TaxID=4795 RepID=A0A225WAL5_9STRA|nr:Pol Polyprotein [Phytophthora megakarya]
MEITLAGKQTMTLPTRTMYIRKSLRRNTPYTNDFLVIDVPEGQDVLLGMPWLKSVNPDINWVSERVKPRREKRGRHKNLNNLHYHKPEQPALPIGGKRRSRSPQRKRSLSDYFSTGYYSAASGTTKYITSKQFRRLLKKPSIIECIFVLRPKTEKECGGTGEPVDIESFCNHPVFPLLLKHKDLFKPKLPMGLPPRELGEHVLGLTRKNLHFDVNGFNPQLKKKAHTVRRTLPMPRKDYIIAKMQGAFWYSCMDLLSGYYQFRMRDCDIRFTAFQTPDGAYEYLVLPMGLSHAPATLNDGIRRILSDLNEICQCYFDDIYLYTKSKSLEDHLTALDRVLTRLEDHKVYVKLIKCVFLRS